MTHYDFLKKEMVVERGMVTLGEQDSEAQVREKIASSLKEKYKSNSRENQCPASKQTNQV